MAPASSLHEGQSGLPATETASTAPSKPRSESRWLPTWVSSLRKPSSGDQPASGTTVDDKRAESPLPLSRWEEDKRIQRSKKVWAHNAYRGKCKSLFPSLWGSDSWTPYKDWRRSRPDGVPGTETANRSWRSQLNQAARKATRAIGNATFHTLWTVCPEFPSPSRKHVHLPSRSDGF